MFHTSYKSLTNGDHSNQLPAPYPLVELSWAAQQVETSNRFAFPSYCDGLIMKSNSASQPPTMDGDSHAKSLCVTCFAAFRDRLRAVECLATIDQLEGASSSVGQSYGAGHPLKVYRNGCD